jgi:hypothetical protein
LAAVAHQNGTVHFGIYPNLGTGSNRKAGYADHGRNCSGFNEEV